MASLLEQVVGHNAVINQLQEAVVKGRLPSTLLFVGPSGIGKKRVAMGLAQLLACETQGSERASACGTCPSCIRVAKGSSENLLVVEPEGLQIKMEQAQGVLRYLSLAVTHRSRLVVINEAHRFNPQAANALLKSLEEPPDFSHFVLIAPSTAGLLPTIRSRAQVFRFAPLKPAQLEQIVTAPDWVIRSSQGRVELAHQLLEPDTVEIREQAVKALMNVNDGRKSEALAELQEISRQRESSLAVARVWLQLLRDAVLVGQNMGPVIHEDQRAVLEKLGQVNWQILLDWAQNCLRLESEISANVERSLCFEHFFNQMHTSRTGSLGPTQ